MGLTSAAGECVLVTTKSYGELHLSILTMGQMAEIGGVFHDRIRDELKAAMEEMNLTPGQKMIVLRDIFSMEPSYTEIVRFCQTPMGIPLAIRTALANLSPGRGNIDLDEEIGAAIDLAELAATLVGIRSVEDGENDIPDPSNTTDQPHEDETGDMKPVS